MAPGTAGGPRGLLTPALVSAVALSAALHVATYVLNVTLPLHVAALGGSATQVGMLFSVTAMTSMFLRPAVGGWIDRLGIRPVLVPGAVVLVVVAPALQLASTPAAVIALMAGVGVASALVATPASVLAAQATVPARRGEAISIYYVASSAGMAIGAPAGMALYRARGAGLGFAVVTGLALVLLALALSPATRAAPRAGAAGPRLRLYSRHALAAAGVLVLVTLGSSSLYAFVPLHAMKGGAGAHVTWFFALYSAWLVGCRVLLGRVSDRLGRAPILTAAAAATTAGFGVVALPPSAASLALAALLLGTGASLFYPTLVALVVDRAPEAERGLAIGTLAGAYDVGVVVGSALVGAIVEHASYGAGFAAAALSAGLGLAAFLALERRRARSAGSPGPPAGV